MLSVDRRLRQREHLSHCISISNRRMSRLVNRGCATLYCRKSCDDADANKGAHPCRGICLELDVLPEPMGKLTVLVTRMLAMTVQEVAHLGLINGYVRGELFHFSMLYSASTTYFAWSLLTREHPWRMFPSGVRRPDLAAGWVWRSKEGVQISIRRTQGKYHGRPSPRGE